MSVIAPVFSFDLNGYTGSGLALQDKAEKSLMQITIGIDISKETLDAYRFPDNQHIQVANGRAGHKTLVRWIGKENGSLVVFEATGAYHRNFEAALAANGTAFANPRQARRFAEATGRLAKTDRVDAIMLAKMGAILGLKAHEPKTEALHILRELITARRALMKDKVAAKTRLQTTRQTLLKNQINARLNQIKIQIRQIDAAIAEKVAQDETLSNKLAILISIPGIAETTAFSMLIEMPELGTLEGKQAASLAGLAPMSRQSGKWQGKERIKGGRAFLRRAIYMPALVATRYNPGLKAKYDQLIRAGKSGKVALTAIMRKLVVMANALLRDGRIWSELRP